MFGEQEFVSGPGKYCEWGSLEDGTPYVAAKVPPQIGGSLPKKNVHLDIKVHGFLQTLVSGKEIGLLLCLIRIKGLPTLLAPINHYWSVMPNPLDNMIRTREFRLYLYELVPDPVRRLRWNNLDFSSSAPVLADIKKLPPWTDEEFLEALGKITESPDELWDTYG